MGRPSPPEHRGHGPTDARTIAGILYELYYRNRISSWPPYTFATDVSIDFITRVKELSLPGVEIESHQRAQVQHRIRRPSVGLHRRHHQRDLATYKEKAGTP